MLGGMFKNTLYVRIKPEYISVRSIETKNIFEDTPRIALNQKMEVVAVGKEIETLPPTDEGRPSIHNAFKHPRTIISDATIAGITLRHFFRKVTNSTAIVRPAIIFHPLESLEGGITPVEANALYSAGARGGAREIYIWIGRELMDTEIHSWRFPDEGMLIDNKYWGELRERKNL
jgi:rod shape-determining protein MreB